MGLLFIIIGVGWALIGVGNFMGTLNAHASDTMIGFSMIFQFILFIFPGLVLMGIGQMMRNKAKKKEG